MELIKHSDVWINEWKLRGIQNTCKKNPREMVRKLMKAIVGEDLLKKSSPTGKGDRQPIPTDIYDAVYGNIF